MAIVTTDDFSQFDVKPLGGGGWSTRTSHPVELTSTTPRLPTLTQVAAAARATVGQPARELADAREELKLQAALITKLWGRIAQLQNALREAQANQPTGRKD